MGEDSWRIRRIDRDDKAKSGTLDATAIGAGSTVFSRPLSPRPLIWAAARLPATFANPRFGELADQRRNQIDLDACEVRVNASTSKMDDGWLIDGRSGEVNRARSRWPRLAPLSGWSPSSGNRASQPFATRPFA